MNSYNIILLSGKAGSGKDTVADYLVSKYNFKKDYFANPLKKMVCTFIGADEDPSLKKYVYDTKFKGEVIDHGPAKGFIARHILQNLGTNYFRDQFALDIWVNHLAYRLFYNGPDNYVISDCRFDNEANLTDYLMKLTDLKITWNVLEIVGRGGLVGKFGNHSSENSLTITRNMLDNSGSLEELYEKVDKIYL